MSPRRVPRIEPLKCVCEPGGLAHHRHAEPGKKAPAHMNPNCPHSEMRNTTRPLPKPKTVTRIRLI